MMRKKQILWGCSGIGCLALLAAFLFICLYVWYIAKAFDDLGDPNKRRTWLDNPTKIEEAIGIRLPDFTVKKYIPQDTLHFTGDFVDSLIIEFKDKLPNEVFDSFEHEAAKIGKSDGEDFCRINIDVDSMGLRYSNPRIFNHDEFISITLWRDSLNGVITYGKW